MAAPPRRVSSQDALSSFRGVRPGRRRSTPRPGLRRRPTASGAASRRPGLVGVPPEPAQLGGGFAQSPGTGQSSSKPATAASAHQRPKRPWAMPGAGRGRRPTLAAHASSPSASAAANSATRATGRPGRRWRRGVAVDGERRRPGRWTAQPRQPRSRNAACVPRVVDHGRRRRERAVQRAGRIRRQRTGRSAVLGQRVRGSHGSTPAAGRARPVDRSSSVVRSSPRTTRSWATKAASGPASRCGASSAQQCDDAATSVSGPNENRPAPSVDARRRPRRRRQQRQAVLGQRRRRPELEPRSNAARRRPAAP